MNQPALTLRPIRNDSDYRATLKLAEAYFDALLTLIHACEARHFPIATPDAIARPDTQSALAA